MGLLIINAPWAMRKPKHIGTKNLATYPRLKQLGSQRVGFWTQAAWLQKLSTACLVILSFIQQIFMENLPCARHCSMNMGYNRDQNRQKFWSSEVWEATEEVRYQVARHWLLFWLPGIYSNTLISTEELSFLILPFGHSLLRLLLKVGSLPLSKPGCMLMSWDLNL